ncbi:hypothetical protein ACX8XN_15185 [Calditrichota bacterium GD2]
MDHGERAYVRKILAGLTLIFVTGFLSQSAAQDSLRTKLFGIKPHLLQIAPLRLAGDSLNIQMKYRSFSLPRQYYDLKRVMPANRFLWDYRESSYYTPLWVQDKLARIMNRPSPGEVMPIFPIALIAARLAMQQMEINKKIAIKAQDYLVDRKYWPILKALWEKAPQSAEQLYRLEAVKKGRTLEILKQDLQFLVEQKLLKWRALAGEPTQYFPAQSRGKAILLLEQALQNDRFTLQQKQHFLKLKNYITD